MRRLSLPSIYCSIRQSQPRAVPARAKCNSAPRTCNRSLWPRPARFTAMVIPSAVEGSRSATLKVDSMGSLDPAVGGLGLTLILIQHGRSQFQGFITLSAKHARNLFAPRLTANLTQLSEGAPAAHFFRHHELRGCCRRHRWQMGNAKHLMALRQLAHARADGMGNLAADVRVNLIEDEQRHRILRGQRRLDREHQAGNFPA